MTEEILENKKWYENLSEQQKDYWRETWIHPDSICNDCKDSFNCPVYEKKYSSFQIRIQIDKCKDFKK